MSKSKKGQSYTDLARRLSRLPQDKRKAALEISASLAAVSLKVSKEFVEAVPRAGKILTESNLRDWGELGRKVAMADAELGVEFFARGVAPLRGMNAASRSHLFGVCRRQLILSSSIALETFDFAPDIAKETDNKKLFESVTALAYEIANRSAKHSNEFLKNTPDVIKALARFGDDEALVAKAVFDLAEKFARRTGGMTSDLWAGIPGAIRGLEVDSVTTLMKAGGEMLEYGGSVTLHFVSSGSEVLRRFGTVFNPWLELTKLFGQHGNAVLISFLRSSPKFFGQMSSVHSRDRYRVAERVIEMIGEIAGEDAESALAAFKSSTKALRRVTLKQFEEWIEAGLDTQKEGTAKARRSYFALETRRSNELLEEADEGLALDNVSNILRIYVEGLTGREVEIAPLAALPSESRIGDGKTIYLPSKVNEFENENLDFRLYKVLAAHGAGQIEFGTFDVNSKTLRLAWEELNQRFEMTPEQLDAFSLAGYIEEVQKGETALSEDEYRRQVEKEKRKAPKNVDFHAVIKVFPDARLARRIFGTMENARIDKTLRRTYRGLVRDLDLMQEFLRERRPYIFDLPMEQVPSELLFQITLCGGATDDARQFYGQIVSEIESVIDTYLSHEGASVADSLMAAGRVYSLFENVTPEDSQASDDAPQEDEGDQEVSETESSGEAAVESQIKQKERVREADDIRDMFNAWSSHDEQDGSPQDVSGSENWAVNEIPEQPLAVGEEAFSYDEWDRELADFRTDWCRVVEKQVRVGDRGFVELARSRYRGVITSVRHQFQLMKPENLTRINREIDGEEYDLNAMIDFVVDKKSRHTPEERIYTKRLRRERDVAVSLLLDQSSSTARSITKNPLQPYTNPGRRIIEIEKEGLVLMSEALEAVGDIYSINGFTSEGRRNVKYYVVKDFAEKYSEDVERKIGGITFENNTRLGAAIRHTTTKLLKQESRTKLLIVLTDGRPYDHDYGDASYAKEDVREALTDAKMMGITPFCITIDRNSEQELRDLYGEVGYTIIDDVLSLPERLPNIYRRLTS